MEAYKNNWVEQRKALEQLRRDVKAGRRKEYTYGYDPVQEMPFFANLKVYLFGSKSFDDLSDEEIDVLKDLTNDVLDSFQRETRVVNFWDKAMAQQRLRTAIVKRVINRDVMMVVPDVFERRSEIAQRLMEIGFQHFGGAE